MLAYLVLSIAVFISAIAAYYSIYGFALIFSGAFVPVILMGTGIEVGKIVCASWLYRNWRTAPMLLRYVLLLMVLVTMLITSMGVFGFLSRAHLETTEPAAPVLREIATLDQQLSIQERIIRNAQIQLDLIAATNARFADNDRVSAQTTLRASNETRRDRERANAAVLNASNEINRLNERKIALQRSIQQVEQEVGPIKYIAEMIYGKNEDSLDKAVRLVILMLIFVFDPLAMMMLLAANHSFQQNMQTAAKEKAAKPSEKDFELALVDDDTETLVANRNAMMREKNAPDDNADVSLDVPSKERKIYGYEIPNPYPEDFDAHLKNNQPLTDFPEAKPQNPFAAKSDEAKPAAANFNSSPPTANPPLASGFSRTFPKL